MCVEIVQEPVNNNSFDQGTGIEVAVLKGSHKLDSYQWLVLVVVYWIRCFNNLTIFR